MRHRHLARSALIALAAALAIAGARADDIALRDAAAAQQAVTPAAGPASEAPFLAENAAAMDRMMADMDVKPTGDVDADFVAMMIPHHQGAIDMAQAVLRYGKNQQIRRIAQEIVVEQQQEIAAMRLALGQPLPPSLPAPTQTPAAQGGPSPAHDHSAMSHMGASNAPDMDAPMSSMPMSPTMQMK